MAIFRTRCKHISATQLVLLTLIVDPISGLKFIGNIGDWHVIDQDGNTFLLSCYLFALMYLPTDLLGLLLYANRYTILRMRLKNLKLFVKQQLDLLLMQEGYSYDYIELKD